MKISVLLSVFVKEKPVFLKSAIASIFNQTFPADEVVIIKDGKLTDQLEVILSDFKKLYPNKFNIYGYEVNKGLGFALNYGLNKCSNELIFRMDTDDIALPERFEKQINAFKKNPKLVIVGSSIKEFNNIPGDLNQMRITALSSFEIEKNKLSRNPFNHMTVAFKKFEIESVGGYLDLPGYEDYYLWLRLLQKYKNCGYNIKEPLVYARVGNNMISRRQGYLFFQREYFFQKQLLKDKITNNKIFIKNLIIRGLPRFLPTSILDKFYTLFLRL
jgi:glycosyltransferase involved in cell wall biosynthesis